MSNENKEDIELLMVVGRTWRNGGAEGIMRIILHISEIIWRCRNKTLDAGSNNTLQSNIWKFINKSYKFIFYFIHNFIPLKFVYVNSLNSKKILIIVTQSDCLFNELMDIHIGTPTIYYFKLFYFSSKWVLRDFHMTFIIG